jgi:phosphatidate cytidylyltransferase
MERALRNRLTFGPAMLAGLFLMLWLDHVIQVWTAHLDFWPQQLVIDDRNIGLAGVGILALLLVILPLGTAEVATLFTAEQLQPYPVIAALGSGAMVVHAFLTQFKGFKKGAASVIVFVVVSVMLLAALRRALGKQSQQAISRMAGTLLSTLYLGGLGWFIMALRVKQSTRATGFRGSTMVILMILLVVKFTDIGAFFGGRALGRRKLISWLSPGKTWEGLFCGLLTAGMVGAICSHWIGTAQHPMHPWLGFIFGVVIGGIGQLGDLLESLMKRDADVKDSGSLIPGFGGILDVIDSPLLAAPAAYLMFSFF